MVTENKLPPHDIDAEESVISSLLIDGTLINRLNLDAADFYSERGQLCFAACKALADRNVGINQITLAQELNQTGKLELIGGAAYLSHLIANCPSSVDCDYYAEIIKRLAIYREIIVAGDKIAVLGYSQGPDVADALNKADEILLSLRKSGLSSPIITPEAIAKITTAKPQWGPATLPAGTYKGQSTDVKTFGVCQRIEVRADLPADLVYAITAVLYDHFDEWAAYHSDVLDYKIPASLSPEKMPIPIHDGAIRYYKEKGFWKAEQEARHQSLLEKAKALGPYKPLF